MDRLESLDTLFIRQEEEWMEVLTDLEAKNKYLVMDASNNLLYIAAEYEGSFWTRNMLKSMRPFTINIMTPEGNRLMSLQRPFRFFFHKVDVFDRDWKHLGTIQKRFSFLRRKYSVLDSSGFEVFQLFGPILHPWTFVIQIPGGEIGKITKKWSGLLREVFTKADNFSVTFPADLEAIRKCLLLGAVFLIDIVHFEKGKEGD